MGAEHCNTPSEAPPPGFAYHSSFFLKKVQHKSSKDTSVEAFDVEKLKKSVGNKPWMLNDKFDQFAKEYQSLQPNEATRRQCPRDAKGDVLEEAPLFRPSDKEFSDTLKYIESIRIKAEPYGLCRIIPPPSWQPPCVIKEKSIWEYSKFVARIQQFDRFPAQSEKDEESGLDFTLKRFQKHADDFTQHYFFSKNKDVVHDASCEAEEPSVESIEGEYRKIVENPTEKLEVLYGDLDTATFGSGFPKASNHRELLNYASYIQSSWNLNNVPTLPGSLLSFESDKTSGVLVPQLHIGMLFSSHCWKVEEHHLYSVCYLHVGSPKIWYSIPERYSLKFEAHVKKNFPDMLGRQFKLREGVRTRLSPFVLKSEGVPVYRCIQYPGEFVLVFPGAYHSTFDCGFNVAEAVNFAPIDWLPHGQNAVALYQSQGRKTSISFDKLLIGAAREAVKAQWEVSMLEKNTVENLRWKGYWEKDGILAETLKSRVKQEGMMREYLCSSFQTKRKDKIFGTTGKRECSVCYTELYLSAAHCPCSSDRYLCLNHAKRLCYCTWTRKIFLYQYEISELNILVEALEGEFKALYTWGKNYLNLSLHTPKGNSFTEDAGNRLAAASIKAEIKARIQQSQRLNERIPKEKTVSTPRHPSMSQGDTSVFLREVMQETLSSSSSESDDATDDGGKGLSTELRVPYKREVVLSKQRRPPKKEVKLSELLKDVSDKHGTVNYLKSTPEELPMNQPGYGKRQKK